MLTLRPLFGLLLALILAASSVTMAVAHGQSPMGMRVEICADGMGQVITLTLDANGQPVAPSHPCPDCLAGLAAFALPEPSLHPQPPLTHSNALQVQSVPPLTGISAPATKARDPPSF